MYYNLIAGKEYHTYDEGSLILDEDNNPIESHICICAAWEESECCCGAWYVAIPTKNV
jgi:hypothetical protein